MPYVMNYDNLLVQAANYLERDDLEASYPIFVRLAEKKVARILKAQLATLTVTDNLTTGNRLVQKPQRWIETLSFTVQTDDGVVVLKKRARETIQSMYPDTTVTGVPKYYSEWEEDYFYIGPTPDDNYAFELINYQEPIALDENNQTNYLTDNAPDLLLYSTLLEAEAYLKNDDRVPLWKAARDEIITQYTGLDMRRQNDRQQVRQKGA